MLLLTKVLHSTSDIKSQGVHNFEKRTLRGLMITVLAPECPKMALGLMMTVLAPECSKMALDQRTREVTPSRRVMVMFQTTTAQIQMLMKCPDLDSMVGESVPEILTKETGCQKRV